MKKNCILFFYCIIFTNIAHAQIYSNTNGSVFLKGVAAIETITAESKTVSGSLNISTFDFSFKQPLNNFVFSQGSLQKQHAEDNYWEIEDFPSASFKGKILNNINLKVDGKYPITAKGIFTIHGISKEIKIPALIEVKNGALQIDAVFKVFLSDHKIKIPRLMTQKVSDEWEAKVQLLMKTK